MQARLTSQIKKVQEVAEKQVNSLQVKVRTAVSRDKFRFQDGAFDLDLCYVTSRIIAMGYPGTSIERAWRNNKEEVVAFFSAYHIDHYLVVNVSERPYDSEFFQKSVYLGWPDHHPPALALLMKCVQTMDAWLNANPYNVVAVHCMAGRGRTGTVIAAFLLYIKMFSTTQQALEFFASRRSAINEGVQVPSQKRYVEYFRQIVQSNVTIPVVPEAKKLRLKCILMRPTPAFDYNGEFTPSVVIENFSYAVPIVLFSTQNTPLRTFTRYDSAILIEAQNLIVQGDTMVRVYSAGMLPQLTDKSVFRFGFHTTFIQNYVLDLSKDLLDSGGAGQLKDERISRDFGVRLIFSEA